MRFYIFSLAGIVAFAAILYWRSQLMYSQEYVEFPRPTALNAKQKKPPLKGSSQTDQLRKALNDEQN